MPIAAMRIRQVGVSGGDPFWANVSSLLHLDGPDGSTTFLDEKGYSWTSANGASISTARSKFGGASLLLNGSNQRITTPNGGKFDFGSGDFTLEGWIYPISNNANVIISNWYGQNASFCAFILYLDSGKLQLSYGVGSTNTGTPSSTSIPLNQWTYVACCRQGTTVSYYINGVKDPTTFTLTGSLNVAPGEAVAIGCLSPFTGPALHFDGNIDEVRVTKGVARYTSSFTPPAAPFPNS